MVTLEESPPEQSTDTAGFALRVNGLEKRYGNVRALRGLDLTVKHGEVYGFLGRNGAGKTTAIRIAMGITRPSAGSVELFAERMRPGTVAARRRVGYVAQEQSFYGWMTATTIGRFVAGFFPSWDTAEYRRYLGLLELPTDRKIRTFSGGMRAKLALALALAHEPELLILDEPTAGLDAVARREFIAMVRDQAEQSGRTTFFSSHLIDEVEAAADRVGIIDDGRTIYEGDLAALSARVLRVTAPTDSPPPAVLQSDDVRVLHDHTRRDRREIILQTAGPADIRAIDPPWEVAEMSLEDIFVALVAKPLRTAQPEQAHGTVIDR